MKNFKGFTLAEVLITLGVIGVVAAMTLPTLIQNHKKHVIETKLKKFYSMMNQAIRMSEAENGTCDQWDYAIYDEGGIELGKESGMVFFDKYLAKYLKVLSFDEYVSSETRTRNLVRFADGTSMTFDLSSGGIDIHYFPIKEFDAKNEKLGVNSFAFSFSKNMSVGPKCSVEPYTYKWNGTYESLMSESNKYGCNEKASKGGGYCTKLIQQNGWKIPKDYPFRF